MRQIACVLSFVVVQQLAAQSAGPYSVTHSYPLGGTGSWDYVIADAAQHRVFIGRQDRVMVVDATSGKLIGEVTGIHGAHGVAIAERAGQCVANSGDDTPVGMF